jgi:hypothetical protein
MARTFPHPIHTLGGLQLNLCSVFTKMLRFVTNDQLDKTDLIYSAVEIHLINQALSMPVVCSYQTPAEDLRFSQTGLKDPTCGSHYI